jgi:tripartite-type tricarboxylate transporter receptor subunit TctC
MLRRSITLALAAACAAAVQLPAQAQTAAPFPSKPIRLVASAAAGGATDFVSRTVGERLSKSLGQPVVVDNKAGANGALAASEVARAAPDGYTLLVTLGDTLINNLAMYKTLGYEPFKDFAYITQAVRSPAVISVNPEVVPAKNMADLRRLAGTQRGKLTYGSWGPGGLGHLAGEQLSRTLDADMVHVPQRGEAPVMADLLSKTVSLGLTSAGLAKQHVLAGKVNALAIMGRERSPALPQVPTMREQGFDDPLFDAAVYIAFLAPARTPEPVMKKLTEEIRRILADPEVGRLMNERGLEILNSSPAEFAASHRAEAEVILKRIKDFGLVAQ